LVFTGDSSKSSASLKSSTGTNHAATTNSSPSATSAASSLYEGTLKEIEPITSVKKGAKEVTTKKAESHNDNSSNKSTDDDDEDEIEDGQGNDLGESGERMPVVTLTDDDGNGPGSQEAKQTSNSIN